MKYFIELKYYSYNNLLVHINKYRPKSRSEWWLMMPKKKDTLKTLSVDRRTNESNEEFVVRAWGAGESAIDEIRRREEKEEELHKAIKNKNYRRIARLVR